MIRKFRAVFRNGAFQPVTPCDVPENSEVDLMIQESSVQAPEIGDAAQRLAVLVRITERMQGNPLPETAPRFSRDELHERR